MYKKDYFVSYLEKDKTVNLLPIQLSGIYLEYLLKKEKIKVGGNKLFINDQYNLLERKINKPINLLTSKTGIALVTNANELNGPNGPNGPNIVIEKYTGKRYIYNINLSYYESIIKALKIYLFDDINSVDDDIFFSANPIGDIYKYDIINKKLIINDKCIIKEIDETHILVGYPDPAKMLQYNFLNNLSEICIRQKSNFSILQILNRADWSLESITLPKELKTYNKIINENNLLEQPLVICKYIFTIFEINRGDKSIGLMVKSINEYNSNHTMILEKSKEIIENNMMKKYMPDYIFEHKANLNIYVNLAGYCHIVSEYVNPLSNISAASYLTFNMMKIEDLIYDTRNNLLSKIKQSYFCPKNNLIEIDENNNSINNNININSNKNVNIINNNKLIYNNNKYFNIINKKEAKVIFFEINFLSVINTIITINDIDFYYFKIKSNIYNINKNKINYENKQTVSNVDGTIYNLLYTNEYTYEILEENLLNNSNIKLLLSDIPKYKITIPNKVIRNRYLKFIPRGVKIVFLCKNVGYQSVYIKNGTFKTYIFNNHIGIFYERELKDVSLNKETHHHLLWITHNDYYNYVNDLINMKKESILNEEIFIPPNIYKTHINDIHDINEHNYNDIKTIIDYFINLNYNNDFVYCHELSTLDFNMLHIKFMTQWTHTYYNSFMTTSKNIVQYSRNISYELIKAYLEIDKNYFWKKDITCFIVMAPYLYEYYLKQKNLEGGNSNKDTENMIKEYLYLFKNVTYDKYIKYVNTNYIVYLDEPEHKKKLSTQAQQLVTNINKMLKLPKEQTISTFGNYLSILEYIKNNNNVLLISGQPTYINFVLHELVYSYYDILVYHGDGKHFKEISEDAFNIYNDDLEKHTNGQTYGNYVDEPYNINYIEKLYNKYNHVFLCCPVFEYRKNSLLFSLLNVPIIVFYMIYLLNSLKDKGNAVIQSKMLTITHSTGKMIHLLINLFEKVEIKDIDEKCTELHFYNFNKKQYDQEYSLKLINLQKDCSNKCILVSKNILMLMDLHGYDGFYKNNNNDNDNKVINEFLEKINIEINIKINGSKNTLDILENIWNHYKYKYMSFYSNINVQVMTNEITPEFIENQLYKNLLNYIKLLDRYNISYNKYFTTELTNYNKKVIGSLYNLSNTIKSDILLYDTNYKKYVNPSSNPGLKLDVRIKDMSNYSYDIFNESINKLFATKYIRTHIVSGDEDKLLRSVAEDFTRGLNKYITEKYKIYPKISNGFIKLYELIVQYDLINNNKIKSFHMCEAPGQFIYCTKYYCAQKNIDTDWFALSLNPYNESNKKNYGFGGNIFGDDYGFLKKYPNNWIFGPLNNNDNNNGTGDILDTNNIIYCHNHFKNIKIDFITGDGGLPIEAELITLQKLDFSQMLLTIALSKKGSNCVIKTFVPFMRKKKNNNEDKYYESGFFINLIYMYSLCFTDVKLCKPYGSNPTSGEFYIIGISYKENDYYDKLIEIHKNFKLNQTFIKKEDIPEHYIHQIYEFIKNINDYNILHLEKLYYFMTCLKDDNDEFKEKNGCTLIANTKYIEKIHKTRFEQWIKMFKFKHINKKIL